MGNDVGDKDDFIGDSVSFVDNESRFVGDEERIVDDEVRFSDDDGTILFSGDDRIEDTSVDEISACLTISFLVTAKRSQVHGPTVKAWNL